jgi:hypothetical protein
MRVSTVQSALECSDVQFSQIIKEIEELISKENFSLPDQEEVRIPLQKGWEVVKKGKSLFFYPEGKNDRWFQFENGKFKRERVDPLKVMAYRNWRELLDQTIEDERSLFACLAAYS